MNNTFDFKRFGQVLVKDWKNYIRNFGISLIVWSALPVLLWITSLVFDVDIVNGARFIFIGFFVFGALLSVPSKAYGKANLSRDGVSYAMLPATTLEKFFSMVFYCTIVTTLIVGLGCWLIDTLMALMPFGGFVDFVVFPKDHLFHILVTIACQVLLVSSIFVYGNMLFTKRKAGKTFGWVLLILFVFSILFSLIHGFDAFDHWVDRQGGNTVVWVIDLAVFIIAIILYYLSYRKMKKQTY